VPVPDLRTKIEEDHSVERGFEINRKKRGGGAWGTGEWPNINLRDGGKGFYKTRGKERTEKEMALLNQEK